MLTLASSGCIVAMDDQLECTTFFKNYEAAPAAHVQFLAAVENAVLTGEIASVQKLLPHIDTQNPVWGKYPDFGKPCTVALNTALNGDNKELLALLLNNNFLPKPSPDLSLPDWSETVVHLLYKATEAETTNSLETLIAYAKCGKIPPLDCTYAILLEPFVNDNAHIVLRILMTSMERKRDHLLLLCRHAKLIPTYLNFMARIQCDPKMRQKIVFRAAEQGALIDCANDHIRIHKNTPLAAVFEDEQEGILPIDQRGMAPLLLAFGAALTNEARGEWAPSGDLTPDDLLIEQVWQCALSGATTESQALIRGCLEGGATLDAHDRCSSLTPCMILAARGRTSLLRNFFTQFPQMPCLINAPACDDWQALSFAAYNGHDSTVRFLLSRPELEKTSPLTASGLSPYKLAIIGKNAREMARRLDNRKPVEEDNGVIDVFDEFNRCRMATLLSLGKLEQLLGISLPLEIIVTLVDAYRLADSK